MWLNYGQHFSDPICSVGWKWRRRASWAGSPKSAGAGPLGGDGQKMRKFEMF